MYSVSRIARRLYSSAAEIPKGFWWLKYGELAAVSKPKAKSDLEYLKNNGVTHLVSLTETVPDFHGVDLTSVHMPVENGGMNSIEQANDFYKLVEQVGANGGSVALHCGEGQGRASVLLACYAVKADSLKAEEAIQRIRQNRPNAISNEERENLVKAYEKSLKQ
ncbi:dual specificity protein phosphatase 23-like [Actinia tenebrosa]|uniref:Dual specificity protein phosphatase 23-like n=1 Tax=Actinia tenebrosa TaxID=6105 RepID=A0A6P8IH74_ACTTE|nr:dual specificity protein phosphatase 23-like [Actinia tenebrosa]